MKKEIIKAVCVIGKRSGRFIEAFPLRDMKEAEISEREINEEAGRYKVKIIPCDIILKIKKYGKTNKK
jgi:hypothetical protein